MSNILENLFQKISANKTVIEDFFAKNFAKTPALFYNSMDLRHSDFKIAPIDTNCFPAGFNHLSPTSKKLAKKITKNFTYKICGCVEQWKQIFGNFQKIRKKVFNSN